MARISPYDDRVSPQIGAGCMRNRGRDKKRRSTRNGEEERTGRLWWTHNLLKWTEYLTCINKCIFARQKKFLCRTKFSHCFYYKNKISRHAIVYQLLYIWLSWVFWLYIIVNLNFYPNFQCFILLFYFCLSFLCGNKIKVLYRNHTCVCVCV